jgi:hypothetical protein
MAFLATALFPLTLAAGSLIKQRTGLGGVLALLLGTGALGLLFYGFSVAESWDAVLAPVNALALGAALFASVVISLFQDFSRGLGRRVLLLAAFAGVAVGAGAFQGIGAWIQRAPPHALVALGVTNVIMFSALYLLPAPRASSTVRAVGFVCTLLAMAGLVYTASAGNWSSAIDDLGGRATKHGTVAAGAVVVLAVAHAALRRRI